MLSSTKEVEPGTMAAWYAKFKTLQIGLSTALLPRRCFLACRRRSLSPSCVKTAFQKSKSVQRQYDRGISIALANRRMLNALFLHMFFKHWSPSSRTCVEKRPVTAIERVWADGVGGLVIFTGHENETLSVGFQLWCFVWPHNLLTCIHCCRLGNPIRIIIARSARYG